MLGDPLAAALPAPAPPPALAPPAAAVAAAFSCAAVELPERCSCCRNERFSALTGKEGAKGDGQETRYKSSWGSVDSPQGTGGCQRSLHENYHEP